MILTIQLTVQFSELSREFNPIVIFIRVHGIQCVGSREGLLSARGRFQSVTGIQPQTFTFPWIQHIDLTRLVSWEQGIVGFAAN